MFRTVILLSGQCCQYKLMRRFPCLFKNSSPHEDIANCPTTLATGSDRDQGRGKVCLWLLDG